MRKFINLIAIIAIVGVAFTGCQKKSMFEAEKKEQHKDIVQKEIVVEKSFPASKTPFKRSIRTVYIDDGFEQAQACKAITVTDIPTGKKQEWLLEDARTQAFLDHFLHTDETHTDEYSPDYGKDFGLYYRWSNNFSQTVSWDGLVYEDSDLTTPINGFRIPTINDFYKLGSIIGSTKLIPRILRLKYDGIWVNNNYYFNPDVTSMWIYAPGDPNTQPGCGVSCMWKKSNGNVMALSYTNIDDLGQNIRIVRNIK